MNLELVDIAFSVMLVLAFLWALHLFNEVYGAAASEVQAQSVKGGDSTLAELYINISPEVFFIIRVLIAAAFFFVGNLIFGLGVGIMFAAAGFVIPKFVLRHLRAKRIKMLELQLVEGLELLGNSLKSGLTLPQAVEILIKETPAPLSQEFSLVMAETRLGVEFTEALENMAKRLNSTIVYILASGVTITKRCGGDLTVIFSNIAATIRERATIEGKLEAVTAQGRFQGLILGMMPFALVIVLYFIDRDHVRTLFGYQIGIMAFSLVVIMVIMAQLWIHKLMQIDV